MSRNSGVPLTAINPRYHAQVVAALASKQAKAPVTALPLTMWLNYKVPSWNRLISKHWTRLHGEKKAAAEALAKAAGPAVRSAPTCRVHVLVTLFRCQLIDPDNAAVKPLIDQMRYAGFLRDDNNDCMALTIQQVRVKKRHAEGTRVTMTEALP